MVQTSAGLTRDQLQRLRDTFAGDIITPADGGYDEARRLWNAVHDRRPAVVVRPTTNAEVATAIRFARECDLALAVRSGGHSASGHSSCDGGLVVDMSRMRGVSVDPTTRVARTNGGALLGELDVAAQAHGLVCPTGVIGHTGVAGLTLGGGVGRLQRNFGLTIDSLRAVELVTADGRFVRASAIEQPDLFWGMRGAGWNFGIATAFEFDLHPFGPELHRGAGGGPAVPAGHHGSGRPPPRRPRAIRPRTRNPWDPRAARDGRRPPPGAPCGARGEAGAQGRIRPRAAGGADPGRRRVPARPA
jgi:FAD/FMN-containing dehydrogenase